MLKKYVTQQKVKTCSLSFWSAGHEIMDFRFYLKVRKGFLRGRAV